LTKMPVDASFSSGAQKISIETKPAARPDKPDPRRDKTEPFDIRSLRPDKADKPAAAAIAAPPPRKMEPSGSWEFDLSAAAPDPPAVSPMEMPLPTESKPPPAPMQRSLSELEMSLPIVDKPSAPPQAGSDLEASIPTFSSQAPISAAAAQLAVGA